MLSHFIFGGTSVTYRVADFTSEKSRRDDRRRRTSTGYALNRSKIQPTWRRDRNRGTARNEGAKFFFVFGFPGILLSKIFAFLQKYARLSSFSIDIFLTQFYQ
jgi:hypothetical protein